MMCRPRRGAAFPPSCFPRGSDATRCSPSSATAPWACVLRLGSQGLARRRGQDRKVRAADERDGRRLPEALPPRSRGRRGADPPAGGARLRHRRRLPGDGARRGPHALRHDPRGGAHRARGDAAAARAGGGGARPRAPRRDRAPRHQARQRDRAAGRAAEADGLRRRAPRRLGDDHGRAGAGLAVLRVARADRGRHRHGPLRRLLAGGRGLRDADRPVALPGQVDHAGDLPRDARAARAAAALERGAAGALRRRLRAGARQGPGAALRDRHGVHGRARPARARVRARADAGARGRVRGLSRRGSRAGIGVLADEVATLLDMPTLARGLGSERPRPPPRSSRSSQPWRSRRSDGRPCAAAPSLWPPRSPRLPPLPKPLRQWMLRRLRPRPSRR
jgi:hypothetical protein